MSLPLSDKETANKLKHRASVASILLATGLSLLKLVASLVSGSLSVFSSMVDSLSDVLGSAITFVAIKYSAKPATFQHRYGYGKAEAISAVFQALFVAGSGLFVIYDAIYRFVHPRILEETSWSILVMVISLVLTLILIAYQRYVAKVTGSQAILADSAHYGVDVLTNVSIIISLTIVDFFEIYWFDTLAAVGIALYLLWSAFGLIKKAFNILLDHELSDDVRGNIQQIITNHAFVRGFHDLRTRDSGNDYLIELHLELDGNLSLFEAHRLSDIIESDILKAYPNAQIIIHQDPAGICEERLDEKLAK